MMEIGEGAERSGGRWVMKGAPIDGVGPNGQESDGW